MKLHSQILYESILAVGEQVTRPLVHQPVLSATNSVRLKPNLAIA